jgi:hypothetical protein
VVHNQGDIVNTATALVALATVLGVCLSIWVTVIWVQFLLAGRRAFEAYTMRQEFESALELADGNVR